MAEDQDEKGRDKTEKKEKKDGEEKAEGKGQDKGKHDDKDDPVVVDDDHASEGGEQEPVPVSDYKVALGQLVAIARATTQQGADPEALRRRTVHAALMARSVRQEALFGLERRKYGLRSHMQECEREEARAAALEHDVRAAKVALSVITMRHQQQKDVESRLSIDAATFLEKFPTEDGEPESEVQLLKRRINHEIELYRARARQYEELAKEKVRLQGEAKAQKKFFQSALQPLEELKSKIAAAYQAVAGSAGGPLTDLLPGLLPVPLYTIYLSAIRVAGCGGVALEGSQAECEAFLKSKPKASELYPLRVVLSLSPDGALADDLPAVRLHYAAKDELVVVEAVGFDSALAAQVGDEEGAAPTPQRKTYRYRGLEVAGAAPAWAQRAGQAPVGPDGRYDVSLFARVRGMLVERIAHRIALQRTVQRLRVKGALNAPRVTALVQEVMPGMPDPRVTVSDVEVKNTGNCPTGPEKAEIPEAKLDISQLPQKPVSQESGSWRDRQEAKHRYDRELEDWTKLKKELEKGVAEEQARLREQHEREARRRYETALEVHFPKQIGLRIDQGSITYKVKIQVGPNYPQQPPQCQLKVRWKAGDEEGGGGTHGAQQGAPLLQIPRGLAALAPAEESGAATQFRSLCTLHSGASTPPAKRRRKRAKDAEGEKSAMDMRVDPTAAFQEVQDYYDRFINRDVVRDTPPHASGQVLVRQVLLSLYFIEHVHPHVTQRGVARLWAAGGTPALAPALGEVPAEAAQLLPHCATPLRRGRGPQLPLQWDPAGRRWGYPAPRTLLQQQPGEEGAAAAAAALGET
eukprot:TRINITY_DN17461_c0_g4_i1.p1 TRINITY_DN17461_c0_g4~~TRINITY_DN17461_c0_g4_i1.p1  ORF type:complete len:806 (+),score=275.86 TRINITY_DN17461_c0_g4_i1:106-2523(+)